MPRKSPSLVLPMNVLTADTVSLSIDGTRCHFSCNQCTCATEHITFCANKQYWSYYYPFSKDFCCFGKNPPPQFASYPLFLWLRTGSLWVKPGPLLQISTPNSSLKTFSTSFSLNIARCSLE